jgi:hypothetical protein
MVFRDRYTDRSSAAENGRVDHADRATTGDDANGCTAQGMGKEMLSTRSRGVHPGETATGESRVL